MADLFSEGSAMTLPPIEVDSLVYSFVKDNNPCLLTQIFSKEKCRELEKTDHFYGESSLLSMLRAYREIHPKSDYPNDHVEKNSAEKTGLKTPVDHSDLQKGESGWKRVKPGSEVQRRVTPIAVKGNLYSEDVMHRRFCRIADPQMHLDLVVFNHFHMNSEPKALEMLFDGESREKFAEMVTKIDVPSVSRLAAHRRKEKEKSRAENKSLVPISTCQLCKKNIKGTRSLLMCHIGLHEDIPMYCFVEGCDNYSRSFNSIVTHLQRKHLLYRNYLTASQYHLLQTMKTAYYKNAVRFLDKYFPPESFVGFSDRKIQRRVDSEDEKCVRCEEIVKVARSRQRHVIRHLNLSYACVVEGCQAETTPPDFGKHLKRHHSKKVRQLNAQELHQHRLNKDHFNKTMKSELSKYFPRKSGAVEEVEE